MSAWEAADLVCAATNLRGKPVTQRLIQMAEVFTPGYLIPRALVDLGIRDIALDYVIAFMVASFAEDGLEEEVYASEDAKAIAGELPRASSTNDALVPESSEATCYLRLKPPVASISDGV